MNFFSGHERVLQEVMSGLVGARSQLLDLGMQMGNTFVSGIAVVFISVGVAVGPTDAEVFA
jgi:hypothetical protein